MDSTKGSTKGKAKGSTKAKAAPVNRKGKAAARKAWRTARKANPDAGRDRALRAVATRKRNIARALREAEARGAAKAVAAKGKGKAKA